MRFEACRDLQVSKPKETRETKSQNKSTIFVFKSSPSRGDVDPLLAIEGQGSYQRFASRSCLTLEIAVLS